jgi:hypothetical protein
MAVEDIAVEEMRKGRKTRKLIDHGDPNKHPCSTTISGSSCDFETPARMVNG